MNSYACKTGSYQKNFHIMKFKNSNKVEKICPLPSCRCMEETYKPAGETMARAPEILVLNHRFFSGLILVTSETF